jgi:hypothetical protein
MWYIYIFFVDISHRYIEICSQRFAQPVKFLKATAIINKKLDLQAPKGEHSLLAKETIECFSFFLRNSLPYMLMFLLETYIVYCRTYG